MKNKMSITIRLLILSLIIINFSCNKKDEILTPKEKFDFSYKIEDEGVVKFENLSNNLRTYEWDFGDSVSSNEYSPIHQYFTNGVYSVNLKNEVNDTTIKINISNANAFYSDIEVQDNFTASIEQNFKSLGIIYSEINGAKDTISPSQLPPSYQYNSKYLSLAYWVIRIEDRLFIFAPSAKIEKNNFFSFINSTIIFRESRILHSENEYLVETDGKWQIKKLKQNKLSGTYNGTFFSESEQKIYRITFTFEDIFLTFIKQ
jgi:PKD domain